MLLERLLHGGVDGHAEVLDGLEDVRQERGQVGPPQEGTLLVQLRIEGISVIFCRSQELKQVEIWKVTCCL